MDSYASLSPVAHTMGTLGDRIGRRRLLLIGGALFDLGLLPLHSRRAHRLLIVTRALLGVAGPLSCLLRSRSSAHVFTMSTSEEWQLQFGSMPLSSVDDRTASRRFILSISGGLGVPHQRPGDGASAHLGPILLPEFRDPNAGRLDIRCSALAERMLALIMIKRIANPASTRPLVALIVGGALAWIHRSSGA